MKYPVFSLLLFFQVNVFSQGVKFGVFADPQFSWAKVESREDESNGYSFGINGGLLIDYYFQKNYALQTGIGLGTEGVKILYGHDVTLKIYDSDVILPSGTSLDYRLKYLTVPLGLKLKTKQIGYLSYYARIGFTNQFTIGAHGTSDDNQIKDDEISDAVNIYNLSYHFGLGVEYGINDEAAFTFGLLYHNGFTDITPDESAKVYSRLLSLRMGFIF